MYLLAILIGRIARFGIRLIRRGGGSALPGLILSKIAPGILRKTLAGFSKGLVVITGSAGKSTTTKMVVSIARAHGLSVFTNPSTANILQGYYSTIIEKSDLFGRISGDIAIFEMDEGHAAELVKAVAPRFVTILNVLDDQLDRFVDPALVRDKLGVCAAAASDGVILNGDDQNVLLLAQSLSHMQAAKASWFGIDAELMARQEHGLGYAPTYASPLGRPVVASEVRSLDGLTAAGLVGQDEFRVQLPNRGLHFALDAVAALETSRRVLGEDFDLAVAVATLDSLPPVFARGEVANVRGQDVEFILVQNPMSFQLNLDYLTTAPERIMVAIGRDVHDPSWLWTVDLAKLSHADVVSGFNAHEMAMRMAFDEIPMGLVTDDLEAAVEAFFELPAPTRGVKTVLFSADAMRRIRRMLGLTDPEDVQR